MNRQRCPRCGALNGPESRWCTQCHLVLSENPSSPAPASEVTPEPADTSVVSRPLARTGPTPSLGSALLTSALRSPAPGAEPAGLRASGPDAAENALARARWTCEQCETENTYLHDECAACGVSLFDPLRDEVEVKDVPPAKVLAASLAPGGGFVVLGQVGQAAMRAMFTLWAFGLGFLVPSRLPTLRVLFLLVGLAGWAVSAHDALAFRDGRRSSMLLRPKVVMAAVGILMAVLLASLMTSAKPGQGPTTPLGPDETYTPGMFQDPPAPGG